VRHPGRHQHSLRPRGVARLSHRGPDQQSPSWRRSVGRSPRHPRADAPQHRRSARHRAARPRRRNASIVFNGEIYNWVELRTSSIGRGWDFHTKTDTEVALVAYLEWGHACLERFNGMFALAIWDGDAVLLRPRPAGQEAPLLPVRGKRFEFASEVKAFGASASSGNELFDLLEFCFDEHTLYRDVFIAPAGAATSSTTPPGARCSRPRLLGHPPPLRRADHRRGGRDRSVRRAALRRREAAHARRRAGHDVPLGGHRLDAHCRARRHQRGVHLPVRRVQGHDRRGGTPRIWPTAWASSCTWCARPRSSSSADLSEARLPPGDAHRLVQRLPAVLACPRPPRARLQGRPLGRGLGRAVRRLRTQRVPGVGQRSTCPTRR
jgi:hypothetical protein